jgi:uncharacterized membrane protein
MKDFLIPSLAFAPGTTWALSYEGISPGQAFGVLALLVCATLAAYWRWAPGVRVWKKGGLVALRILACVVLVALLAKPVLVLTLQEPVRQPLAVMVDGSDSMTVEDRRENPEDLQRAAIATGMSDPAAGLKSAPPADAAAKLTGISRADLLLQISLNPKLDLWRRLAKQSDLSFYRFGRSATQTGATITQATDSTPEDVAGLLKDAQTGDSATAIGESLRQVLQEPRPQALGGVLLITDGESNAGSSALEAAMICKEQNVPLFVYGTGVTSPRDIIVQEVRAPKLAFAGERLQVTAHVGSRGLPGKSVTVILKADGEAVDQREITLGDDRGEDVALHFIPTHAGDLRVEMSVPPQPGEATVENNQASTSIRITDRKFHVLLIEQEPRWDFRYLLEYLRRDPRLEVKCSMIDGEPGLDKIEDSPFLPTLPDTREAYFSSQVLILGDVNPEDLGEERMRIIADWVEAGGGIIFLAGPNFSPNAYADTPLEPLLPVVPDNSIQNEQGSRRATEPFQLHLTRLGEQSPYLQMDPDPEVNREIWSEFPGVRWTAPIVRVKPGAEVLLVDPRPERAGRYGQLPVFAMQGYGSGTCVYLGTDETYRWRSRTGEKYYSILWGQIMQSLSLQLLEGASSLTQLKTDRKEYGVGDPVIISGNAYTEGYEPYLAPSLDGAVTAQIDGKPVNEPLSLHPTAKNSYRGEFIPKTPGSYSFATTRDPGGILKFEVVDMRLEQTRTALDDRLLQGMADTAGGQFLREEDLYKLPELIGAKSATVATFKKIEIYQSAWMLGGLFAFLFLEWFFRKLSRLK